MNGIVQGECKILFGLGVCVVNGSLAPAHAQLPVALQDGGQPQRRASLSRGVGGGGGGGCSRQTVTVAAERW